MERAETPKLLRTITMLQTALDKQRILKDIDKDHAVNSPEATSERISEYLPAIEQACLEFPLPATAIAVHLFKNQVDSMTPLELASRVELLRDTLMVELDSVAFFYLNPSNSWLYHYPLDGWESALTNLPQQASDDVEEAAKCRATRRYTACVIHLCRALECAFKHFAIRHSITFKHDIDNTSWEALANDIKEHRDANKTTLSPDEIAVLNEVRDQIIVLKGLWRNKVTHSTGTFYTEEQVQNIYPAVRGLMTELANK